MKPTIIIETELEQEIRRERERRSDGLLAEVERIQSRGARWQDVRQMLSWGFAMWGRMESAPAIDPARELIQGAAVDRDERIHAIAYVKQALTYLARKQGDDRGVMLLWLHFRAPSQTGEARDPDGRKRVVYGNPSVAIRDLYREVGGTRAAAITDYWRAIRIVEEYSLNRHWIQYRLERRAGPQEIRVYRRQG